MRSFTAGQWFQLTGSDLDQLQDLANGKGEGKGEDDRRFLLTSVLHAGINNLPKGFSAAVAEQLGHAPLGEPDRPVDPAVRAQAIATGYGNAFEAIRAQVPWRPQLIDDTGARRHVKPSAQGMLTATVVGPDVSVRRTHLELRPPGDNDPVQLTNSWTRWERRTVASADGTQRI